MVRPTRLAGRPAPARVAVLVPALGLAAVIGCTPTVQMKAPDEPITINLNVKLDADVRVQLAEQAREDIANNPDLF
jgi:hypothetical protein